MFFDRNQICPLFFPSNGGVPTGAQNVQAVNQAGAGTTLAAIPAPLTGGRIWQSQLGIAEVNTLGLVTFYVNDTMVGPLSEPISGNIVDGTSFVPLDAAGTRAALGMAAANMDTQLSGLANQTTALAIRTALGLAAANLDTQLANIQSPVFAGIIRAALGMAAANLDAQLAAIGPGLTAAGVRAALGMAAANLDTQIATLSTLNSAGVRAALGMAAANLDAQLAAIGPGLTAAGVRAAIGMAAANLDTQIGTLATPGAAMTLTAGERTAVANALLDLADAVELGLTVRQAFRLNSAVQGGVVTLGVGTATFKGAGVATNRLVATVPGDGSRPAMGLTL